MIRRRSVPLFSLSFLDCICCGFGAIILLFVLTMGSQTKVMQELRERLQKIMAQQLITLAQFRQSRDELLRTQSRASQVPRPIPPQGKRRPERRGNRPGDCL